MKKILFLAAGLLMCTSCEKEDTLAGTKWIGFSYLSFTYGHGISERELIFTGTTMSYLETITQYYPAPPVVTTVGFTGTYIYEPPSITIEVTSPEKWKGFIGRGIVETLEETVGTETRTKTLLTFGIRQGEDEILNSRDMLKQ